MSRIPNSEVCLRPNELIHAAIDHHGAGRVLAEALGAYLRGSFYRRPNPPDADALPARMREDVGLPPPIKLPEWWY